MRTTEDNIAIANRLYECRRAARSLLGNNYESRVTPRREVIQAHMAKHHQSAIKAVLVLSDRIYHDADGVGLMMLMAATCDLLEKPEQRGKRATSA